MTIRGHRPATQVKRGAQPLIELTSDWGGAADSKNTMLSSLASVFVDFYSLFTLVLFLVFLAFPTSFILFTLKMLHY